MTRSLCNAPSSGLLKSTFLRRRNSLAGSPPVITGVSLLSLTTEGALETGGRVELGADLAFKFAGDGAEEKGTLLVALTGGTSGLGRSSVALLLRLMMDVSSCLNFSRSVKATG
jgi:hypothetical protein